MDKNRLIEAGWQLLLTRLPTRYTVDPMLRDVMRKIYYAGAVDTLGLIIRAPGPSAVADVSHKLKAEIEVYAVELTDQLQQLQEKISG